MRMAKPTPPSSYARLVQTLREEKGLTTRQVASKGGLSASYITMVENGDRGASRPKRESVLRMGKGLDASPSEQSALLRAAGFFDIEGISPEQLAQMTHQPIAEAGIVSDPTLRDDHRRLLLSILRSLRSRPH